MIFFTSDTHFGTSGLKLPVKRNWSSIEAMDNELIKNWNDRIHPYDTVYHLGDFSKKQDYDTVKSYLDKLNGKIILISGNHDSKYTDETKALFFEFHYHQFELVIEKNELFVLNHCPMVEWNKSHHNSYHLFGHCHGVVDVPGKAWDVGVDNNNFIPLSIDTVRRIMGERPDNSNYVNRNDDKLFDYSRFY